MCRHVNACGCFKQFLTIMSVKILQRIQEAKSRTKEIKMVIELIKGYWADKRACHHGMVHEEQKKKAAASVKILNTKPGGGCRRNQHY